MKTIHFFCMLLVLFAGKVFSQTINEFIVLYPSVTAIAQVNGSSYGSDVYHIGKRTVGNDVYISRSYFNFGLGNIPDNATISQVEVVYSTGGSGYSFKLTKLVSVGGGQQAVWAAIGNASSLHTGVPYASSGNFNSSAIKTEIQNALGSNVLLIGGLSESEGTNGSNSSLSFQLNVNYSYPAPEVDVTVRNDLNGGNGGNVGVAIYPTSATSQNSPYSFTAHVQDRLNLAAYDNQTVNGKVWFFNDTEYQNEQSEWKKYDGGQFSHLSWSASFTTGQLTENDDDATFNAYLKTTSYTTSGTMSSNETWFTSPVTITDNLTIPSGVTLTIRPGVTVQVASGKKIAVNGNLAAAGSYSSRITFSASGGTWYGIEFWNGANGSEMTWTNVTNAQYGIYMYNTNVWLESNSVKYNTVGMRFENQSDGAGIVKLNVVAENNDTGIQCLQYSDPLLFSFNLIRYNNFYGVYGDNTSAPDLGIYSDQGHNGIYYNNDDVYSSYGGTIYARYNWWGDYPASPTVSYNVDYSNALDYDPTSGMSKASAEAASTGDANNELADGANADTLGMAEVNRAQQDFLDGKFEQAQMLFEGIVQKYADHFASQRALAFVSRCLYKLNRRNEVVARMNQLVQNHAGKEVFGLAQSIATGELVKNGQYAEAIAASQAILSDFPKTILAQYALYDLGSIYWYRLADQKTGEAYYRQLIAEWPDDDLTISALATLGEWKPAPGKGHAPALSNAQKVPKQYALSQNFPNPFLSGAKSPAFGGGNPQTMIQYQLPEASHITVKIYNLFGQEVRTLVASQREAGYHTEIWDGRDDFGKRVASGVYFYRLSVEPNATQPNRFQFTRKMVLTQ